VDRVNKKEDKMNFKVKHTAWVLTLFLLSGCALKDSAPVTEYTLSANPVAAVSSNQYRNRTIKVSYPDSLKEKLSRNINYSYSLSDRGVYQNSQWSNAVPRLIQGSVIESLEQSHIFKGVLPPSSTAYADYRLESSIYDFSHHVRGEASYAIVSIRFTLIDTNTGKMTKTRKFMYKEYTKTTDARGFVASANVAMSKLSRDLVNWLR
jgi:cholesterol transport system auxiliary component